MAFLSVHIAAGHHFADLLSDALLAAGALSVTLEDADAGTPEETPQFGEPGSDLSPLWMHSILVALFPEHAPIEEILIGVEAELGLPTPIAFTASTLQEENWVALTQAQFEPMRISDRLWITPSWHEAPDPQAISLVLDPGMAFGTGSHPTTRLCLEWLEAASLQGKTVLDYGCGSGILGIAAAKLGAKHVTALDIDTQALIATEHNARTNGVALHIIEAQEHLADKYDFVLANILANPLRVLAPALCAQLAPKGALVLSGILAAQAEEIITCYAPYIALSVFATDEGWVCLSGQKDA